MEHQIIATADDVPDLMNRSARAEQPASLRVVITDIRIGFWRAVSLVFGLCAVIFVASLLVFLANALVLGAFAGASHDRSDEIPAWLKKR